jgi:hypothetical protein
MILSDKSSGSSILQRELTKHNQVHIVEYTRHYEMETLFWIKAAAVLGLPQDNIHYSEVPFEKDFASKDLLNFLNHNIPQNRFEIFDKKTVFSAWTSLCIRFGPFFLEKSPHHLHIRSALDLISEYIETEMQEIKFIGIIRNPMDTLYSSWKRWGALPELCQFDWLRAYKNLLFFKNRHPDLLRIIRYEDLVSNSEVLSGVCKFLGIEKSSGIGTDLHEKSKNKWKKDKLFGFQLAPEVYHFASHFGYCDKNSNPKPLWYLNKLIHTAKFKIKSSIKH